MIMHGRCSHCNEIKVLYRCNCCIEPVCKSCMEIFELSMRGEYYICKICMGTTTGQLNHVAKLFGDVMNETVTEVGRKLEKVIKVVGAMIKNEKKIK